MRFGGMVSRRREGGEDEGSWLLVRVLGGRFFVGEEEVVEDDRLFDPVDGLARVRERVTRVVGRKGGVARPSGCESSTSSFRFNASDGELAAVKGLPSAFCTPSPFDT